MNIVPLNKMDELIRSLPPSQLPPVKLERDVKKQKAERWEDDTEDDQSNSLPGSCLDEGCGAQRAHINGPDAHRG